MTRTRLSSSIQSSKLLGNNVLCPRSWPSTKRFISSPAYRAGILTRESLQTQRFHTAWVICDASSDAKNCFMSAMPRKRQLAARASSVAVGQVWTSHPAVLESARVIIDGAIVDLCEPHHTL